MGKYERNWQEMEKVDFNIFLSEIIDFISLIFFFLLFVSFT